MMNVERTPNTRAVLSAALETQINYSNRLYKDLKEVNKNCSMENIQESIALAIKSLDDLYFIFRYTEKEARIETDGLYWKRINQAKADLCRLRNKLRKPNNTKKNVVSVRSLNKMLSFTSCYNTKINTSNTLITNRHMMVFDVIATELSKIMEVDEEMKQKALQYTFKSAGEVEQFLENIKQGASPGPENLIAITLTNDKFRKITGLKIDREKIKQLITETSKLNISCRFSCVIGDSVYISRYALQDVPFILRDEEATYNNGKVTDEYHIALNLTPIGCLLINNLVTLHFDMMSSDLYSLSGTAQNIYRKAKIYSYRLKPLSEESIIADAGVSNRNNTSVRNIIINALEKLKGSRLIDGYTITEGVKGNVYNIYMPSKKKSRYYRG